jgi:hypothetical protein
MKLFRHALITVRGVAKFLRPAARPSFV